MNTTVPHVAPATYADVPQLVSLLGDLFAIERDFSVDPTRQRRGLELLLERREHAIVFAAHLANDVVGMITAQLVVSTAEGAQSIWVEDVVVGRYHRRRGIGRALVNAALDWGRTHAATRAQLLVDQSNSAALAFYSRLGWQATQLSAHRVFLEQR